MGLPARSNDSVEEILERAARRATARDAAYAGDLTPLETAALLREGAIALIDVRSEPEWIFVGRVPGTRRVEWSAPGVASHNPDFVDQVAALAADDGRPFVFLCRSGLRSERAARAASLAGIAAYNMLEGFEGDLDRNGHRSSINGWRHAGLPWVQGRDGES